MFFQKKTKKPDEASGLTRLEQKVAQQDFRLSMLETRITNLEMGITHLCNTLVQHFQRIDENAMILHKEIHSIAAQTIRPPKDLLNGHDEIN